MWLKIMDMPQIISDFAFFVVALMENNFLYLKLINL